MKYNIIYADPPWAYRDKCHDGKRGAGYKYDVMDYGDIGWLPVGDLAAPDCLLAMWWVGPQPLEALAVMTSWGFTLKNMTGFTWCKRTESGKRTFGMGHYTRGCCENVLFAVNGNPKRVCGGVSQYVEAPYRGHSVKPFEVADLLVQMMGDVPRIELFARDAKPGWDCWGHEAPGGIEWI